MPYRLFVRFILCRLSLNKNVLSNIKNNTCGNNTPNIHLSDFFPSMQLQLLQSPHIVCSQLRITYTLFMFWEITFNKYIFTTFFLVRRNGEKNMEWRIWIEKHMRQHALHNYLASRGNMHCTIVWPHKATCITPCIIYMKLSLPADIVSSRVNTLFKFNR